MGTAPHPLRQSLAGELHAVKSTMPYAAFLCKLRFPHFRRWAGAMRHTQIAALAQDA